MDYTAFFQTALDEHRRVAERHRNRVREQHARIVGLLTPLLSGMDDTLSGQLYRDSTAEGPLLPYQHGDESDLTQVFGLECCGHCLLKVELGQTKVELKNGIKAEDWYLADFDEGDVQQIARIVADTIIPHVADTCRPRQTSARTLGTACQGK